MYYSYLPPPYTPLHPPSPSPSLPLPHQRSNRSWSASEGYLKDFNTPSRLLKRPMLQVTPPLPPHTPSHPPPSPHPTSLHPQYFAAYIPLPSDSESL